MILIGFVPQTWGRLSCQYVPYRTVGQAVWTWPKSQSSWTTSGLLLQQVSLVLAQLLASLKLQASPDLLSPAHSIAIVAAPTKHKQLKHHTTPLGLCCCSWMDQLTKGVWLPGSCQGQILSWCSVTRIHSRASLEPVISRIRCKAELRRAYLISCQWITCEIFSEPYSQMKCLLLSLCYVQCNSKGKTSLRSFDSVASLHLDCHRGLAGTSFKYFHRNFCRVQLRPGISAGFSSGLLDSFLYVSGVVAELQAPITSRCRLPSLNPHSQIFASPEHSLCLVIR